MERVKRAREARLVQWPAQTGDSAGQSRGGIDGRQTGKTHNTHVSVSTANGQELGMLANEIPNWRDVKQT